MGWPEIELQGFNGEIALFISTQAPPWDKKTTCCALKPPDAVVILPSDLRNGQKKMTAKGWGHSNLTTVEPARKRQHTHTNGVWVSRVHAAGLVVVHVLAWPRLLTHLLELICVVRCHLPMGLVFNKWTKLLLCLLGLCVLAGICVLLWEYIRNRETVAMHFYISCHCSLHIKQKAAEHEPFSCYAKSVKKKNKTWEPYCHLQRMDIQKVLRPLNWCFSTITLIDFSMEEACCIKSKSIAV